MYVLIFIIIFICVYIASFKDSFTKENFDKVSPALTCILLLLIAIVVMDCLM